MVGFPRRRFRNRISLSRNLEDNSLSRQSINGKLRSIIYSGSERIKYQVEVEQTIITIWQANTFQERTI